MVWSQNVTFLATKLATGPELQFKRTKCPIIVDVVCKFHCGFIIGWGIVDSGYK